MYFFCSYLCRKLKQKNMKKIYSLALLAVASFGFSQTTISQWNFDDATPATAMLPTTGAGTFSLIGGVVDNLTSGAMPAGNPSTGKAYSVKTFPASGTASGTAGFQFAVSTVGYTGIVVEFDPRGSGTSSKWQQYEYTTDGATWTVLGNNAGALTNAFTATPMVSLTLPAACDNSASFAFRIVSIFDPAGTDYASVTGGATAYSTAGAWRIDNATFKGNSASVNNVSIAGLRVFSNNKMLYVTSDSSDDKAVVVYDMLGKVVANETVSTQPMNVANLSTGAYIVKVTENGATSTVKLLID